MYNKKTATLVAESVAAGLIDRETATRLDMMRNQSPELERELRSNLDLMQVAASALRYRKEGKVRNADRAAQKAKAVAKRHKKNKNKKTHRK